MSDFHTNLPSVSRQADLLLMARLCGLVKVRLSQPLAIKLQLKSHFCTETALDPLVVGPIQYHAF